MLLAGNSKLTASVPRLDFFCIQKLEKILNRASIPARKRLHAFSGAQMKTAPFGGFHFVLLAGIEPAFHPSQGCVLSIERQERATEISNFQITISNWPPKNTEKNNFETRFTLPQNH